MPFPTLARLTGTVCAALTLALFAAPGLLLTIFGIEEGAEATFVARRTAMAEQKIAQAEVQAIDDVRSIAVDIAVAAAEELIAGKVKGAAAGKIIDKSIAEVKNRLN